jgi:hypothetical protein
VSGAAPAAAIKIIAGSVRRRIHGTRSPLDGTLDIGPSSERVLL